MKEIKAWVRPEKVEVVLEELGAEDFGGLTVRHAHEPGGWSGGETAATGRVEILCAEPHVERVVRIVSRAARTGRPGDGVVYVMPIERVVRIRTGEVGRAALDHLGREAEPETGGGEP